MYLELGPRAGLSYDYHAPAAADGFTLVCFNPLTGDRSMWETGIGPGIREHGHGLLTWNLRGQAGSPFTPGDIHQDAIVNDSAELLRQLQPPKPLFVGLSVGGLYAAQVHLHATGQACRALVLINTLREIGPRLEWINTALLRLAETGGLELLRDVYTPLLLGEDWLAANRGNFLGDGGYRPLAPEAGAWQLLKAGVDTVWDLDWSQIQVPILNITGAQDQIFRDDAVIAGLLSRLADVRATTYAGAGHMIPAEAPAQLTQDLLAFIEQLS